jgi:replicative DNA helicase
VADAGFHDAPDAVPHDIEAEQAVLGSLLLSGSGMERLTWLQPEDFYQPGHARLFDHMRRLFEAGEAVDLITVQGRAEAEDDLRAVGGRSYLGRLASAASSILRVESYARLVRECADRRRLLVLAADIAARAREAAEETAAEIAEAGAAALSAVASAEVMRTGRSLHAVTGAMIAGLERPLPCHPTGLRRLDDAMAGGLYEGRVYGIAARPKQGKSLVLGTIAGNLNAAGVPHLFVTLEMGPEQVVQRMVAAHRGFNAVAFLKNRGPALVDHAEAFRAAVPDRIMFEDRPGLNFNQLRALVAGYVARLGIRGVILDYWQLVQGRRRGDSEAQHLADVAQWLAEAARKFGIFVLTAAQINRDGLTRGSDGLKLACDMYLHLRQIDPPEGMGKEYPRRAWLAMEESRYTLSMDIGGEDDPAMIMDKRGPRWVDPDEWHRAQQYAAHPAAAWGERS